MNEGKHRMNNEKKGTDKKAYAHQKRYFLVFPI